MPRYRFLCDSCGREKERIVSSSVTEAECGCGGKLERQLPRSLNTAVMECKDKHRGTQTTQNLKGKLRERMVKHHDKYELEEKIDKFGMDDALQHGWTKKREKL